MAGEKRRTDRLAEALAAPILQGVWLPGRQLPNDAELTAAHGVSRTVIREALRILGAKGLVVAAPRRGTRVAASENWAVCDAQMLDWLQQAGEAGDWADDARDIRLTLEPGLAALAAARADTATNAALQHMTDGAIVNLASQAGRDGGGPGAVPYATSKGAVMTMTRGLAKELGPNIRVNALCPGMIDTDFHNIHTPDAGRRGFEAAAPVKRQGHVDDAANLVLFLACDDSAFMTGTNIDINGGMLFS